MENEHTRRDPWDGFEHEFEIVGAQVVATLGHDGGAIVENVPRLFCSEGRLYSFEYLEEGELHQLDYRFGFSGCDEPEPYPSKSVQGRIVITGQHTNGFRMEIRGHGWIGYDANGKIEGRFDRPPVIITEDSHPEAEEDSGSDAEPPPTADILNFPMPPKFVQATVRVPGHDDDWLDDD